ncbi:MAG: hypothetical protein JNK74_27055 [Candidatus Hydrogenedentes bacterium]|nr:hypothetical protein [Candidatus Hydrogenedentota bacterium]
MENTEHIEKKEAHPKAAKRVIRLDDLDGEEVVVGGAGEKLLFGEQPESSSPFAGLFGNAGPGTPPSRGK